MPFWKQKLDTNNYYFYTMLQLLNIKYQQLTNTETDHFKEQQTTTLKNHEIILRTFTF